PKPFRDTLRKSVGSRPQRCCRILVLEAMSFLSATARFRIFFVQGMSLKELPHQFGAKNVVSSFTGHRGRIGKDVSARPRMAAIRQDPQNHFGSFAPRSVDHFFSASNRASRRLVRTTVELGPRPHDLRYRFENRYKLN